MALESKVIFESLLEWPHRGAGSEEEMMAREMLVTHLEGEHGVDTVEEAFYAPTSYLHFFAMIAMGQLFVIWTASEMLYISLALGLLIFTQHFLFFDWRKSFLVWFSPKKITANLVAKKGEGRRLFILMAHLDSAPSSYAYRPDQVKNFAVSIYLCTVVIALGVLVPVLAINDMFLPNWLLVVFSLLLIGQFVIAGYDFWQFGYTPGANDNLSGVAAAVSAASRLWRHMPTDAEVRLVITSAEEAGMLGAQHYWEQHKEDLRDKDVYLINLDTVGNKDVRFVTESGGFTPIFYNNTVTEMARRLVRSNERFRNIEPGKHRVGDFDSVWFQRGGVPSVTIASYGDDELMPYNHTMNDKARYVDLKQVELASGFAEAIIRMIPVQKKEK